MKTKWNNWMVLFVAVVIALIITPFVEPYYREMLYTGGGLSSFIVPSSFSTYPSTFLFLYTIFLAFFYRAFAKNFKPINLIYFLALPLLLFISSLAHLAVFLGLLAAGFISGIAARKFL